MTFVPGETYTATITANYGTAPGLELSLFGIGTFPLLNGVTTDITFTANSSNIALIIQPTDYAAAYNYSILDVKVATPLQYEAVVVMTSDYYPFGMAMPGRQNVNISNSEDYRYAYNGMETDNEVSGNGNSYTTEFRQYDPRLGRWKSLDPLMTKYPGASPYSAYNNNPVLFVDPFGLEGEDWVKGGKGYGDLYHWEDKVHSQADAVDQFGEGAEWINLNEGRRYEYDGVLSDGSVARVELHNDVQYGEQRWTFANKTDQSAVPEASGNPYDNDQFTTIDHSGPTDGAITNPGAGVFLSGTTDAERAKFDEAFGRTEDWKSLEQSIHFTVDVMLSFAGGEALVGMIPISGSSGGKTIVGEGMKRVSAAAAETPGSVILNNMPKFTGTADQITSQMMTYNRQWILQQMRSGRSILDIGLDVTRAKPSIFYQMEQNMIKNYLKLHPNAFQIIKL